MRFEEDRRKPIEPEKTHAPKGLAALTPARSSELGQIEIPQLSLPRGGGALRAIDGKFRVNAANGTASLTIALPMSPNRDSFNPPLSLVYSSGAGNGPFGVGWSLGLPAIQRKADKRLPRYLAGTDEDVFMVTGAEDLVPELIEHGPDDWRRADTQSGGYQVRRYRPRIAGDFSRIERITHAAHGVYWKVTSRANSVTVYGRSPGARIADPEDAERIFQWLPEFSYDNKGNWIAYEYKAETAEAMPATSAEANRRNGIAPFTNLYLKRVRYGNHKPYFPTAALPYDPPAPADAECHFELVIDYGEHGALAPSAVEVAGQVWPYRADAFSNCRAGFDVRTARLCRRVLMFHHFPAEALGSDVLVRSLDLTYAPSSINGSGQAEMSYLVAAEQAGYVRLGDGSYARKALPPASFTYQTVNWDRTVRIVSREALAGAPAGLSPPYQFADFFGEGIAGILCETAEGWTYKSNRGDRAHDGQVSFERGVVIAERPNFAGLAKGTISLEDLEASGEKQVVVAGPQVGGFFELGSADAWRTFRPFERATNLDLRDPKVKRIDLTGEGRLAVVVAEENAFLWHASDGKKGFKAAERALRALDEERGPAVIFAEAEQTVFLADMTGDGLTDIVRIRNGEVSYWPNKGFGRFGAKVAMTQAPALDHPDRFDPAKIRLADITGTGTSDLIYLGGDAIRAWINLSGNGWSTAAVLDHVPPLAHSHSLDVADLLGHGTPCLIWSSALPGDAAAPMRYVDLMGGRKPHLLIGYANNLGEETRLEYRSSTDFYLEDKNAGTPWRTRLPFPVHVVSREVREERVTGTRFTTDYSYHHGYWDAEEREFRGFGRVDRRDSEMFEQWSKNAAGTALEQSQALFQAPMLTRTWYHVGAWDQAERILAGYEGEYWQAVHQRTFPAAPPAAVEPELPETQIVASPTVADPNTLSRLSAAERREAARACKSFALRQEIFALDAPAAATEAELQRQLTPYSVATHGCHVQLVQPRGTNRHAVFVRTEAEALTIDYERAPDDPKIEHSLNLEIDELGNVLESARVVYGRDPTRAASASDALADAATDFAGFDEQTRLQAELANALSRAEATQTRTFLTVARNTYTNDVDTPADWRTRLVAATERFEITGLFPAGGLFGVEELRGVLADTVSTEIGYHQEAGAGVQRRPIERERSLYYDLGVAAPLPLGQVAPHGLLFQGQICAFTPALLTALYGARIADPSAAMAAGGYIHSEGDANWWIPRGTIRYLDAGETVAGLRTRFFTPRAYIDPSGSETKVAYLRDYFLSLGEKVDAAGNATRVEAFDYRLQTPARLRDANDNLTAIVSDELGLVKAQAFLGKDLDGDGVAELDLADDLLGIEPESVAEAATVAALLAAGDSVALEGPARTLLGHASVRFVYDLDAWRARGAPAVAVRIEREEHHALDPLTRLQLSFEYSDGSGVVAMTKVQAEPGLAKAVTVNPGDTFSVADVDTAAMAPPRLRWVGNGRLTRNNKGKPVKRYEPYFSVSPRYESLPELVESGITAVLTYDAPGRLIRTDLPDGTFLRTEFGAWSTTSHDAGDTVLQSRWHADRVGNLIDAELIAQGRDPAREKAAAVTAAAYAGTPSTVLLDAFGRSILALDHSGLDGLGGALLFPTTIVLDVEGNTREVIDSRGNMVVAFGHDMVGRRLTQVSMDAGGRWALDTVASKALAKWDERGHAIGFTYDALQRPLTEIVQGGDGSAPLNNVVLHIAYGEGQANDRLFNLRGQVFRRWDTGGREEHSAFDGKGNLVEESRRFAADYKALVDWSGDLEGPLEAEVHVTRHSYDALSRLTSTTAPDGSVTLPRYNEAKLLEAVDVTLPGSAASRTIVTSIDYDAKGQRQAIAYGNGAATTYRYDPFTIRLLALRTAKAGGETAQDLRYTYDPVGNVTHLEDQAIPAVFFNNAKIQALSTFTYDPLSRLVAAEGREHAGQAIAFAPGDNWDDRTFAVQHQPGDAMAWRSYSETYDYDPAGNIKRLAHVATGGSFTRTYAYEAAANRLVSTTVGGATFAYDYHPAHGFIRQMPHLPVMRFNYRNELAALARQAVTAGTPETTYLVYDHAGARIRKVTELAAAAGAAAARKDERLYLGAHEVYRRHSGTDAGLERRTLSIMDDARRVAMIDTRNAVADGTPAEVTRYQLSNHIGSAVMELDGTGRTLGYEEYHPYGTTAYQATDSTLRVAARRYRYSGMERDEESGLSYHQARYYAPWLGLWTSPDPLGIVDGGNLYRYARNNPVRFKDPKGTQPNDYNLGVLRFPTPIFTPTGAGVNPALRAFPNPYAPVNTANLAGSSRISGPVSLFGLGLTATGRMELTPSLRDRQFNASLSGTASLGLGPVNLNVGFAAHGTTQLPERLPITMNAQDPLRGTAFHNIQPDSMRLNARLTFGDRTLGTAFMRSNVGADGTGTMQVGGRLHLPLVSAHFSGSGPASPTGSSATGTFSAVSPVAATFGNFTWSSTRGLEARGHYFGLLVGPLSLDPSLKIPQAAAASNAYGAAPSADVGPGVGYSYFNSNANRSIMFSIGVAPNVPIINPHPTYAGFRLQVKFK